MLNVIHTTKTVVLILSNPVSSLLTVQTIVVQTTVVQTSVVQTILVQTTLVQTTVVRTTVVQITVAQRDNSSQDQENSSTDNSIVLEFHRSILRASKARLAQCNPAIFFKFTEGFLFIYLTHKTFHVVYNYKSQKEGNL